MMGVPFSLQRPVGKRDLPYVNIRDKGARGDGVTDDTSAINAAIVEASAIAAIAGSFVDVIVPPSAGAYTFTSIRNRPHVVLRGAGGTLKLRDGVCANPATSYYLIYNLSPDTHCGYVDLVIDGNGANNASFTVADAITASGVGSWVTGCTITNPPDSGIMFSIAAGGRCSGNRISGARDLGIYINAPEAGGIGDMIVSENAIQNCVFGGIAVKRGTENTTVFANQILSCGNGITVEDFGAGSGGRPSNLLIQNNILKNIGHPHRGGSVAEIGIAVQASENVAITGNKLQNVSGIGIDLHGAVWSVVSGNQLTGYPASPKTNQNVGIRLATRSSVPASNNVISGNVLRSFAHHGAWLSGAVRNIVTSNVFQSTAASGFRIESGCNYNVVAQNVFDGVLDQEIYSGAVGNVFAANRLINAGTEWERAGHHRNIAVTTPAGAITPRFPGQLTMTTTGGTRVWLATGLTNTEWLQIAGPS